MSRFVLKVWKCDQCGKVTEPFAIDAPGGWVCYDRYEVGEVYHYWPGEQIQFHFCNEICKARWLVEREERKQDTRGGQSR